MTVFADSSALVKLYVPESGAQVVRALQGTIMCSALAQVEVVAALWRKHRMGDISADDASTLAAAFTADLRAGMLGYHDTVCIEVTARILDEATVMAARHGLRAYDAVQLATAVVSRPYTDSPVTFACFDGALSAAAAMEGFASLGQ